MRLYSNQMSPYGRKVMTIIHELGLVDRVEFVNAQPRERPDEVTSFSPLGKIPVLTTDDGLHLRDSPVIAEYLATEFGDEALLPASGPSRWRLLSEVADADGIIEAAVVVKNERARPAEQQSVDWINWHLGKVERSLAQLDQQAEALTGRRDLGIIAIGCALGYVPRRLPEYAGLKRFAGLAALYGQLLEWPAFAATEPAK
jgi:glutathione S-transferase